MKAISLWNPWAMLVALGLKRFETRSWDTSYRGPIAIHAAKVFPKIARASCHHSPIADVVVRHRLTGLSCSGKVWYDFPFGAVVAIAELTDVYLITEDGLYQSRYLRTEGPKKLPLPSEPELSFGDYTPGRFAWELKNIVQLKLPIPTKGGQRIWNWTPPEGVEI